MELLSSLLIKLSSSESWKPYCLPYFLLLKPEHGLEWKCWKFRSTALSKTDVDSTGVWASPVYCIYYYFYPSSAFVLQSH